MSKRLISMILILCLAFSNVYVAYGATTTAKVTAVSGNVKVKRAGSTKEFDAFVNMSVGVGDKITTGTDGSVTITVDEVNQMKASKSTSFTFKNLSKVGKEPSSAYTIHYGSVSNTVNKKGFAKDSYKVNTSNTVMGVRGTVFEVAKKISENGDQAISLVTIDGVVSVSSLATNIDGTTTLNEVGSVAANQQIVFSNNDSNSGEVVVLDINKLDADSLRWLMDNKQFLNPEQINNVGTALEKEERLEKQKEEVINKFKDDNFNDTSKNVEMPPKGENIPPIREENDNDNDDYTPGDTDETGETGGGLGTATPVSPLLPAERPTYPKPVSPLIPAEKPTYPKPVSPLIPAERPTYPDPVAPLIPAERPVYPDAVTPVAPMERVNYEINNVDDFVNFNNMLVTSGSAVMGRVSINNDLDMSAVTDWQPANLNGFTVEGNGRTISNLKVAKTGENSVSGLFGTVSNSNITNLNIDNIEVTAENTKYAGALAGRISTNCNIEWVIVSNSKIVGEYAGGIAGESRSDIESPSVLVCIVEGMTTGGIVGAIYDSTINYFEVTNATIKSYNKDGVKAAGGVAGYANNAEILNRGVFEGTTINGTTGPAGGIVGKASNTNITNVHIDIKGSIQSVYTVGGVIGEADNCNIEMVEVIADQLVAIVNSGGVVGIANGTNNINNVYIKTGTVASFVEGASRIVSENNGVMTINHTISLINNYYNANIGTNKGILTSQNSYYLVETYNNEYPNGKTATQLMDSSLYSGWDTNVWHILDGRIPTIIPTIIE